MTRLNSSDRFQLMETFVTIVEAGSISQASQRLGMAQSSVSRQLRALEERFGAALIIRTTHKLALTEPGRMLLPECRRLLQDWRRLEDQFRQDALQPRGTLTVLASMGLGQLVLADLAARYARRHPGVRLDWRVSDEPVAVVGTTIDCVIRVGRIQEASLRSSTLAFVDGALACSPVLVEEFGHPRSPEDLRSWPMIGVVPYHPETLVLTNGGHTVKTGGRVVFTTTSIVAAKTATIAAGGFSVLPVWMVEADINAGRLVRVLPEWSPEPQPVSLGVVPSRQRQAKVVLFVEALRAEIRATKGLRPAPRALTGRRRAPDA